MGHDWTEVVVLIAGYFIYDTGDMLRSKTRQSAELIFHHAVVSVTVDVGIHVRSTHLIQYNTVPYKYTKSLC